MNDSSTIIWERPVMPVTLQNNEAHIWLADVKKEAYDLDFYYALLSSDETERSDRFYFTRDKHRYIITRGILRLLISNYTYMEPTRIKYVYNKYSKPQIILKMDAKLHFNVSHSADYIIYGFSPNHELGIDIEKIRQMNDADGIIKRFCSESEKSEYFSYPAEKRNKIFISCWTRKEAYIKARGEGLTFPLNDFTVSLNPDKQPVLLDVKDEPFEKERWNFYNIDVPGDYYSTLAIECNNLILRYFEWSRENQ